MDKKQLDEITWGGSGMTRSAYDWIAANIPFGSTVLEIGAGQISTNVMRQDYNLWSIEADENWTGLYDNVNYVHAPIKDNWYCVDSIKKAKIPNDIKFILIDGPAEGEGGTRKCFLANMYLFDMSNVSHIMVDDIWRKKDMNLAQDLAKLLSIPKINTFDNQFAVLESPQ